MDDGISDVRQHHGGPFAAKTALLTLGVFGLIFASIAFVRRDDALDLWWQSGAPIALIGMVCGVTVYALTAVYGRALAIVVAPTLRW